MFKLVDTRPTLVQNQEANKCDAQVASSGLISSSMKGISERAPGS
jgi:hypothetical protein